MECKSLTPVNMNFYYILALDLGTQVTELFYLMRKEILLLKRIKNSLSIILNRDG